MAILVASIRLDVTMTAVSVLQVSEVTTSRWWREEDEVGVWTLDAFTTGMAVTIVDVLGDDDDTIRDVVVVRGLLRWSRRVLKLR